MAEEKCVTEFIDQVMCGDVKSATELFSEPWIKVVLNTTSNEYFKNMINMVANLPDDYLSRDYTTQEIQDIITENIRAQNANIDESDIQKEGKRFASAYSRWKKEILKE